MDLGYVATRPRFSRGRRTWNCNVRNLFLEDVRALDEFKETTVKRGSLSFYFPNLVQNGSFELPAVFDSEIVQGWSPEIMQGFSVQPTAMAADGLTGIQIATAAGSIASGQALTAQIASPISLRVRSGEVYQGVFQSLASVTGFSGVSCGAGANLSIVLQLSDGSALNVAPASSNSLSGASPKVYSSVVQQFTIPTPSADVFISAAYLVLSVTLHNSGTAAISLGAPGLGNSISACFDSVGLALIQQAPGHSLYGRLIGSTSLVRPVRFAPNRLPEFSDIGFGGGMKRYGTTFALEEV